MRVCAAVGAEKHCLYEGVISEKSGNEEKCHVKYLDGTSLWADRSDIRILFRPFPVDLKDGEEEREGEKKRKK